MIEMTRDNIRIDPTLEVDTDWNPPCISAYIEIWFDADEKFGTSISNRDDAWINLYVLYSPVYHTLQIEYSIETNTTVFSPIPYEPTEAEEKTIMAMIEEKCREFEGCSCVELVLEATNDDER